MPGLFIYESNSLEVLFELISSLLEKSPRENILQPEIISVQSRGMEKWLDMKFAERFNISANIKYPFPNALITDLFNMVSAEATDIISTEAQAFKIMKILPDFVHRNDFSPIRNYLKGGSETKLYQLSQKIADIFDQYSIFRPDMVLNWEKGLFTFKEGTGYESTEKWQSALWNEVLGKNISRASLRQSFFKATGKPGFDASSLPGRISLFGVSYLPNFYLSVFERLSRFAEINFFILNPCKEYWFDIKSEKIISTLKLTGKDASVETGNLLLASMTSHSKDFFESVCAFDLTDVFIRHSAEESTKTMLNMIRDDILNLRTPEKPYWIQDDDVSIQIHSCHSRMREIEVLQDNLLYILNSYKDISPADIIVMAPDIEEYAPLIDAVFGIAEGNRNIPYSIADRRMLSSDRIFEVLCSILEAASGRFPATDIMSLLEEGPVMNNFKMTTNDIQTLFNWIRDSGIRWSVDALQKRQYGVPSTRENTFSAGLDRILLGYAMPSDELFCGILPYDASELDIELAGKFTGFINALVSCRDGLCKKKTLSEWSDYLQNIIEKFFGNLQNIPLPISRTAASLKELQEISGNDRNISFEIILSYLRSSFGKTAEGNFLAGGVTFCSMLPMRSIPAKAICILGMDSEAFPRKDIRRGFNLIDAMRMPGDRSKRGDDRYLFLEALLSASGIFYISYSGRSIKDNSIREPSVVVSELLDYIERCFISESPIAGKIFRQHPLQAFSPLNFEKPYAWGYSSENFGAAMILNSKPERKDADFLGGTDIDIAEEDFRDISIDRFAAFFENPSRFFLRDALKINLETSDILLDETEPMLLDSLQKYTLRKDLAEEILKGGLVDKKLGEFTAKGVLPHGNPGLIEFSQLERQAADYAKKVSRYTSGTRKDADVSTKIEGMAITCSLSLYDGKNIVQIPSNVKGSMKYLLRAWLKHLLINTQHEMTETMLVGRDAVFSFTPVDNAGEILSGLAGIFRQGMRKPPPLFPIASWEYASVLAKNSDREEALKNATIKWGKDTFLMPGRFEKDLDDPYIKKCFEGYSPNDGQFAELAEKVFLPVLCAAKEGK